ncbi:MAG: NAD(P)-binding protein [Proteobacteria bacterium]|nr:NAD(P)-binding protein [Pseudomonadota bacterium]
MPDKLDITRRDFLNGVALSLAAGTTLSPLEILAATNSRYYPPALTGMRGSHAGSFEVMHSLAMQGAKFLRPEKRRDSIYDLVVVGGGISGLAAAKLFRDQAGDGKRVLVLDNHDDFGGHAKRNEFVIDGRTLLCHGGSQSLESPGRYSAQSKQLLQDLGVEPQRFYDYYDLKFRDRHDLRSAIYFSAKDYGRDLTLPNLVDSAPEEQGIEDVESVVAAYPISAESRAALISLLRNNTDYLAPLTQAQKTERLRGISYVEFLRAHVGVTDEVVTIMRDSKKGYWGFGWDALSALEAVRMEMLGTYGLRLDINARRGGAEEEPYIFHFPDGNASVARLLVRDLVPGSAPGSTMDDIVLAQLDYSLLDRPGNEVRIRLNATAVDVAHTADQKHVDVLYVRDGAVEQVRGRHVILACYNMVIPHICAELPAEQRKAISYPEKTPLAYISIAIRNWRAFKNLGVGQIYQPNAEFMYSFGLDFPVSMGGYQYASSPDEPTVLHGTFAPTLPGQGLNQKQQHRAGRSRMLQMSFDDFEQGIIAQLDGALGGGGFDSSRDIAAITVNRWPHGYAYEYNDLYDPPEYSPQNGPHIAARAQIGRISIANSDSSAYAFVDAAIDAAARAVAEQL